MNALVKNLAEQALIKTNLGGSYIPEEFLEEFAKSIIRECLMKATGAKIRGESIDELIERIKKDFGVEL